MPGIVVSLTEALGVRGVPLAETDVWAILNQSAVYFNEATRDRNKAEGRDKFIVTPDSLCFRPDGGVEISPSPSQNKDGYLHPELQHAPIKTLEAAEKCFIYSLGRSLIKALELGDRKQTPAVSHNLEGVLFSMCRVDPEAQITVNQVIQACFLYAERHIEARNSSLYTKKIYSSIMGSDGSEEEHTSGSSRHDTGSASSRGQRSRGRQKYTRRRERQRSRSSLSRSRSPSRSRSRSRSRHRDSKYDDKGYHHKENYTQPMFHPSFKQPPSYQEHLTMSPGRSYHLSDITFTSTHNGGPVQKGQNRSRPASGTGAYMSETAHQKYLRLKERQRKLKILRVGLMGEGYEDYDPATLMPDLPGSDTRSVLSGMSFTQGSYTPGLHVKHGSEIALRLGRESDRDSIISSEMSICQDQQPRSKDYMTNPEKLLSRDYEHHRLSQDIEMEQKLEQLKDEFYRRAEENKGLRKQVYQGNPVGKLAPDYHDSHKSKDYYGPEFVHKSSKPLVRISVPLQGESLKSPSHVRRVVVVLLSGQKLEAMVDPSITAQQMFESIITHIELPEFFFFGLTYISEGEHFFIEPDMKLHKVAPDGWRDNWKENMPAITLTVYVRMKFYPSSVAMLRHQISKHLLYLQLRHDILEERTLCGEDQCMELSALALQAEYGDYDSESMGRNYFLQEHYFPHRVVKRVGNGFIRDHATEEHQKHLGLTDRQAELEFIKKSLKLQEYGIHFYKLLKNKNNTSDIIWVGINVYSLLLAENEPQGRIIVQQFPWQSIKKISFNKRRFSIQSKPDYGEEKPPKLNYYTNTYRKGRYILQFSTVQHRFELSMRSRESNIDPQELTLDSVAELMCDESMLDDEQSSSESHGASATEPTNRLHNPKTESRALPYTLPPPYKADASVSMLDLREKYKLPSDKKRERYAVSTGDIFQESQKRETGPAYVIEMADQSSNWGGDVAPNETVNTTLQTRFNNELLSPERSQRHVCEIVLQKEPEFGFGITIVGGESTDKLDLGIFVKVVTPGGPADRSNQIKPGDRLIAINGQSLEGIQHHAAVQMIRYSGDTVRLLVSQVRVPKSVKRRDDYDDAISKLRASNTSPSDIHIYRQLSEDDHKNQDNSNHFLVVDIPHNHVRDDPSVADVSTMSQIESIESEVIPISDLPQDTQPIPRVRDPDDTENDVDSDLEEGIQAVIEGRGVDKTDPLEVIQSTEFNEWQKFEAVSSRKTPEILPGEVFEVTLDKTGSVFGLNVTGGKNTSVKFGGIYVKSIHPNSPAVQFTGQTGIQPGDRILSVGEIPMKNVTHKQAVEIIQNAPDICIFIVERGAGSVSSQSSVRSSNSSTGSVDSRQLTGQSSVDIRTPPMMQMFSQGEKQQKNLVADITEESETESKSKSSSSKADSTAHVEENSYDEFTESEHTAEDTIAAEGVKTQGVSESKDNDNADDQQLEKPKMKKPLLEDLVPASLESTGVLEARTEMGGLQREASELTDTSEGSIPSSDGNIYYPFVNKDNTFSVDLNKGSSGLGFSVYGGVDVDTDDKSQGVIRIKKVFPLGPAISCQQIQRDDVLLEVNQVPVKGLTHAAVVSLLHSVASNVNLLMCRPSCDQLSPLPRSSSEEWMERRVAARLVDNETPSETESEDEPILYRDTMSDRGVITPPSGFASPGVEPDSQHMFVPPPNSPPPALPRTPPPSLSLQNSPLPVQGNAGMGRWGNFENLRTAVSPRSVYSDEFNSTFNSTQESLEEVYEEEEGHQNDHAQVKKRSTSSSSQSDASESSTDSIVRSPLKGTYNTGEGLQSTASESGLDAILFKNNKHLGTGTNSLQSSDIPTDEDDLSLGETEQYCSSPTAPRTSPTVPSSTPRESPQPSETLNRDSLQQAETGEEGTSESEDDNDHSQQTPGEIEVVLKKDEKTGLGFSVYGGVSKGGCFIRDIVSDPALSDGRLKTGDRLLKVNDIDLTKLNHTQAVGHLRNARDLVRICVYRSPQATSDPSPRIADLPMERKAEPIRKEEFQESEEEEGETMNSGYEPDSMESTTDLTSVTQPDMISLELDRSCPGGLGFSLVTAEKDNQTGVFVRSIRPNSQADRDGRLQVMDRIVQINGESTVGLTHTKAAQLIKASPQRVTLTVSRFSSRQLETMTPPILLNYSDDEDEEDNDYMDEDNDDADHLTASMKEDVYDSEDDDMDALVTEAEKLLLSSGSLDLSERPLNEGKMKTPGVSYKQWLSEERSMSDENTDLSEYETQDTEELQQGLKARLEVKKESMKNQTFTIDTIQRKLNVQVPSDITAKWLDSLPMIVMSDDVRDCVPALISKLQNTLDQRNHQEEYKELRQVKSTDECTVAKLPENKPLNRFRNILPYDFNRVELSGHHSYINASHILMNVGEMEAHYIAAQGPLPETSQDFWQMIWEQNVSVIAMLTLDVENGKVKCHQYWPDSVDAPLSVCDGLYKLSLLRVQYLEHFDIREIMIENVATGTGRILYHFMFTNWPDQTAPNTIPLLQYLQLIHAHHTTGPISVHCSAGIGRTGALITIDLALAQIEKKGRCDIFEIVTELRKQRYGMIQVKDQYTLSYFACLEALRSLSS